MLTKDELRTLRILVSVKINDTVVKEDNAYHEKRRREIDNHDASGATMKMLDLQDELNRLRTLLGKLEKMYYNGGEE